MKTSTIKAPEKTTAELQREREDLLKACQAAEKWFTCVSRQDLVHKRLQTAIKNAGGEL